MGIAALPVYPGITGRKIESASGFGCLIDKKALSIKGLPTRTRTCELETFARCAGCGNGLTGEQQGGGKSSNFDVPNYSKSFRRKQLLETVTRRPLPRLAFGGLVAGGSSSPGELLMICDTSAAAASRARARSRSSAFAAHMAMRAASCRHRSATTSQGSVAGSSCGARMPASLRRPADSAQIHRSSPGPSARFAWSIRSRCSAAQISKIAPILPQQKAPTMIRRMAWRA